MSGCFFQTPMGFQDTSDYTSEETQQAPPSLYPHIPSPVDAPLRAGMVLPAMPAMAAGAPPPAPPPPQYSSDDFVQPQQPATGGGFAAPQEAPPSGFAQPPPGQQLKCGVPECPKPAAINPNTGNFYEGCTREHSLLCGELRRQERAAQRAAMPPGTRVCALPGCPRPAMQGFDYCKPGHAVDHRAILAGGRPICKVPGCDLPCAPNPAVPGAYFEGHNKEHSLLVGERRRLRMAGYQQ